MSGATVDLHGIERQPFPNFGEDWSYLERVTVTTAAEARKVLAQESGMNPDEHDPQPIHMRWEQSEHVRERSRCEFDEGWLECDADHPDAVPFWKDMP